jgi:hypothetical protein
MRFFGGFFGTLGGLSPLIVYKRYRNYPVFRGLLVASLAIAVAEFPKSILEPFAYSFYASELGGESLLVVSIAAWVLFYLIFGRKQVPRGAYAQVGSS